MRKHSTHPSTCFPALSQLHRQTAAPCMLITKHTCTACCAVILILPSYQLVTAVVHMAMQCCMLCAVHDGVSVHCGRNQHSSLCAGWVISVQSAGVLQQALITICPCNIVHLLYHQCATDRHIPMYAFVTLKPSFGCHSSCCGLVATYTTCKPFSTSTPSPPQNQTPLAHITHRPP